MKELEKQIKKELSFVKECEQKNIKQLKELKHKVPANLPSGKIRGSICHGSPQFYLTRSGEKDQYLNKNYLPSIQYAVKQEYHEKMAAALIRREKALLRLSKTLEETEPASVYEKMSVAKKLLVAPIVSSEEDYIQKWLEEHPGNQNPYPEDCNYTTNRGEKVRSKSEKILADLFYSYQIPYQYEPMLTLPSGKTLYPDFALLNTTTKKTLYWEHLGLVDQDTYLQRNIQKIQQYEVNGILLGETLITSFESTSVPLNTKILDQKIRTFLL